MCTTCTDLEVVSSVDLQLICFHDTIQIKYCFQNSKEKALSVCTMWAQKLGKGVRLYTVLDLHLQIVLDIKEKKKLHVGR